MKLEFNTIEEFEEFVELIYRDNTPKDKVTTEEQLKNEKWLIKHDLQETLGEILDGMVKITGFCKDNANAIQALQTTPEEPEPTIKPVQKEVEAPIGLKRKYSPTVRRQLPKIKKMNKDGTFQIGRYGGTKAKWTIHTILQLKGYIPGDLSTREIAKKVGLDPTTTDPLMFMIETGRFDKYLSQWEQIQADQIYKKVRKVPVENNPQKRRENLQGVI